MDLPFNWDGALDIRLRVGTPTGITFLGRLYAESQISGIGEGLSGPQRVASEAPSLTP